MVLTLALTLNPLPQERKSPLNDSGLRMNVRPILTLEIPKTRRVFLLLLGEKAGLREDLKPCRGNGRSVAVPGHGNGRMAMRDWPFAAAGFYAWLPPEDRGEVCFAPISVFTFQLSVFQPKDGRTPAGGIPTRPPGRGKGPAKIGLGGTNEFKKLR